MEKTGAESCPPPAGKELHRAAEKPRQPDADHPHAHTFHLPQVLISAQPAVTSAAPARAVQAQPGMHRKSSSKPATIKPQPIRRHSPSSRLPQCCAGLERYLTFRITHSPASLAGYARPSCMMRHREKRVFICCQLLHSAFTRSEKSCKIEGV